jgi:subtilisin-like proprotein convertase family protein
MKRYLFYSLAVLATFSTRADQHSYTNSTSAVVPDANPTGIFSTIEISDVSGWITNVTLSLNISGGSNGDLYAFLSSDNGGFAILLNRVGKTSSNPFGYEDAGLDITFSDLSGFDIHNYGGLAGNPLAGTWQPDGRNVDPQFVLDTDERASLLDSFNLRSPNGTWTLYLADFAGSGQSTLVEWNLTLQTIPEPGAVSFIALGMGLWILRRSRFPKRQG